MTSYERSGKGYVDRCVQTLSLVPEIAGEFTESKEDSYDKTCSEISYTNSEDSRGQLDPRLNSAYSHSLATNSPMSVSSPVRSPGLSRRHREQQIIYSRPAELKTVKRRFVSLPEHSPRTVELGAMRIVSMPDRPMPTLSNSDLSVEIFEHSGSSCTDMSHPSVTDSSVYRRHCGHPHDMPRTPSPPSSPESIIIIGNNAQVSLSFLRQKCDTREMFSDDNGWVTWASSPPRPIPALHGPLSLPYARCPSGAEGTLAEGEEDLSHMIWGLGIDGSHVQKNRSSGPSLQSNSASRSQKPHLQLSRDFLPRLSQTRDPIDISRASVLYDQFSGNKITNQQRAPLMQYPFSSDSRMSCPQANTLYHAFLDQQDYEKDNNLESNPSWQNGLGFHLDWARPGQDKQRKPTATLKSSAPTFVPLSRTPVGFINSQNSPSITQIPQRLSAFEIAHQYQVKQQMQVPLPTPPSSSSPQWSPYLHQNIYTPPDLPPNKDVSWVLQQPAYDALDSSPVIRKLKLEQSGNRGSTLAPIDLNTLFSRNKKPTLDYGERLESEPSRTVLESPLGYLGRPPNTDLPPTPRTDNLNSNSIAQVSTGSIPLSPTSLVPMENRRHLLQQQPRSIPLARLIQRRLSSVAEEEYGAHESSGAQNPTSSDRTHELKPHYVRTYRQSVSQKNTTLITQSRNEPEIDSAARDVLPLETKAIVKLPPKIGTKIPAENLRQSQNKIEDRNDKTKDRKARPKGKISQKKLRKQKNSSRSQ